MARIGESWRFPATLPTRVASMVSEPVAAATSAHGDDLWSDQILLTRSAVGSGQWSRWQSEPWDPGARGDVPANQKLKMQFNKPCDRRSLLESYKDAHLRSNHPSSRKTHSLCTSTDPEMEIITSPWISPLKVNSDINLGNHVRKMGDGHQMFEEMSKRDGKRRSQAVSPQFLKLVQDLIYEIPKDVVKTPGVVGRLMSIFRRVKHEGFVDDYVACFVEVARIAEEFVARFDYKLEDNFLVMIFVTGLKEEIRYDVQVLDPKSLSEAINFAQVQEKEFQSRPAEFRDMIPGLTRALQLRFELRSQRMKPQGEAIVPVKHFQPSSIGNCRWTTFKSSASDVSDSEDCDEEDPCHEDDLLDYESEAETVADEGAPPSSLSRTLAVRQNFQVSISNPTPANSRNSRKCGVNNTFVSTVSVGSCSPREDDDGLLGNYGDLSDDYESGEDNDDDEYDSCDEDVEEVGVEEGVRRNAEEKSFNPAIHSVVHADETAIYNAPAPATILSGKDNEKVDDGNVFDSSASENASASFGGSAVNIEEIEAVGKKEGELSGDEVFSGSICKQGEIEAIVIATRVQVRAKSSLQIFADNQLNRLHHFESYLELESVDMGMLDKMLNGYIVLCNCDLGEFKTPILEWFGWWEEYHSGVITREVFETPLLEWFRWWEEYESGISLWREVLHAYNLSLQAHVVVFLLKKWRSLSCLIGKKEGIFIDTILTHINYCLPSEDSGISFPQLFLQVLFLVSGGTASSETGTRSQGLQVQCSAGKSNTQKAHLEKHCRNLQLPKIMVTIAATIMFDKEAWKISDLHPPRVGRQTLFPGSVQERLTTFEILLDISRSSPTSGHLALPMEDAAHSDMDSRPEVVLILNLQTLRPPPKLPNSVFDLCGRTFDVSILESSNGGFEVKATNGATFLAGRTLIAHCLIT